MELAESFCIQDAGGQALAYLYFRDREGTAKAAGVLSRDEARRIAANMAKLLELLRSDQ